MNTATPYFDGFHLQTQGRKKLEFSELMDILKHTAGRLDAMPERGFLKGRRVIVADTPANQAEWPQQSQQKEGCDFPTARICACFSLATGGLVSFEVGSKKSVELPLWKSPSSLPRPALGTGAFFNVQAASDFAAGAVRQIPHASMAINEKQVCDSFQSPGLFGFA